MLSPRLLNSSILNSYEKQPAIELFEYDLSFPRWSSLRYYLQHSNNCYVENLIKNKMYFLTNENIFVQCSHRVERVDRIYLCMNGKLLNEDIISYSVGSHNLKIQVKIFELNGEYYIDAFNEYEQNFIGIYIFSTYSGLFKLIEEAQQEYVINVFSGILMLEDKEKPQKVSEKKSEIIKCNLKHVKDCCQKLITQCYTIIRHLLFI